MQLLATSWANGIAAIAILCSAVSFAVMARSLGFSRLSRGIMGILVFVTVIGSISVGFFANRDRSQRRVRSMSVVPSDHPSDPMRVGEDIVRPPNPPILPRSTSVDIPDPPTTETTNTWETLPERFANTVITVVDRSTAIAERAAERAEELREQVEEFRTEHEEQTAADLEASLDDDADTRLGHRSLPRRGPGTLVTILASTALLYVGYLFLDANTRGQFTWSLRVASLFTFAGIIAAVLSLT